MSNECHHSSECAKLAAELAQLKSAFVAREIELEAGNATLMQENAVLVAIIGEKDRTLRYIRDCGDDVLDGEIGNALVLTPASVSARIAATGKVVSAAKCVLDSFTGAKAIESGECTFEDLRACIAELEATEGK